jgi:hypothetical protein
LRVTTSVTVADVLSANVPVPEKVATMLCPPAAPGLVVQVAVPLLVLTGWAPHPVIVVPPSVNATVPPSGTGLTFAV